jgi:superfamily I DNA/RNA helicase
VPEAVIAGQQLKLSPARSEFDEVHDTERNLFYFACTQARDRLLVSNVKPASDFVEDFAAKRP